MADAKNSEQYLSLKNEEAEFEMWRHKDGAQITLNDAGVWLDASACEALAFILESGAVATATIDGAFRASVEVTRQPFGGWMISVQMSEDEVECFETFQEWNDDGEAVNCNAEIVAVLRG